MLDSRSHLCLLPQPSLRKHHLRVYKVILISLRQRRWVAVRTLGARHAVGTRDVNDAPDDRVQRAHAHILIDVWCVEQAAQRITKRGVAFLLQS